MKIYVIALICLLSIGTGYVRAAGQAEAQGMYRVVWSDGEKNDTLFGIVQTLTGEWMLTDEEGVFRFQFWEAWDSDVIGALGAPIAEESFCLASYGETTDFFCTTRPGLPARFVSHDFFSQSHDFVTKTDYLIYMEMSGIFNLEKVAAEPPVPPLDDAELLELAESGDAKAQYAVGEYYFEQIRVGDNGSTTARLAAEWLGKSAAQGNANALTALAYIHENGGGVRQDMEQARAYYRMAADKGNTYAMKRLGGMLLGGRDCPIDEESGARWYIKAAEQNDRSAQATLVRLYAFGKGVPQDGAKAREWAEKAMEGGGEVRVMTMYDLGEMYARGECVPRHPEKAVYWLRKAAREDYPPALTALAGYYKTGLDGIPPDPVLATALLRRARTLGVDRDILQDLKTLEAGLTESQLRAAKEAYQRLEEDFREEGGQEREPQ